MKFLIQFLVIVIFAFMGEVLHHAIPFPIPSSIYGIILLFTALELKWIKVKDIREVTVFLIAVMPVVFVPAAAGLIDSWSVISSSIVEYAGITVVSTFVVMGVAGRVTQAVIRAGRRRKEEAQ